MGDSHKVSGPGNPILVALRTAERQAELSHYPNWGLHTAYCYVDLASACLAEASAETKLVPIGKGWASNSVNANILRH